MIALNLSDTTKSSMIMNQLLTDGTIETLIKSMKPLDERYTKSVTRDLIASFVRDFQKEFTVDIELYRSRNPWSKAYAATHTGNYNLIKLNSRRLNRSIASICGSISHEWGHCLEYYIRERFPVVSFNHGDNSPVGKDTTFQYQLGRAVKRHVEGLEHEILRTIGLN
jgi:hypothetical protein